MKIISFFFLLCSLSKAEITFKQNSLIQDDELEEFTLTLVQKMFDVAGIKGKPTLYFIVLKDINAAATLDKTLIINTGFILFCNNIEEFIGVLAHEVTHIKAGHPELGQLNMHQAAMPGFLAMALGGIAAAALGSPELLVAGLAGGLSIAERNILRYSRTQENAADAGAIDILNKLSWPIEGLQTFLQHLDRKNKMRHIDPYLSTHPITSERFDKIALYLKTNPKKYTMPEELKVEFLRIRGKISGFTETSQVIFQKYPSSCETIEARYARSIAYYKTHKREKFIKEIDELLKIFPNDSYFLELKGQFFLEHGDKKRAITLFEQAFQMRRKKNGLNLIYVHALLENKQDYKKIITILTPIIQKEPTNIWAWHLLAIAYGRENKIPESSGCLAEEAYLKKDFKQALIHGKKALASKNNNIKERAKILMEELTKNMAEETS